VRRIDAHDADARGDIRRTHFPTRSATDVPLISGRKDRSKELVTNTTFR
jgi:hypothetical protein